MNLVFLICNIISAICLWALLSAIVINFYFAKKSGIVKEKRSIVDTGTMLLFFVFMVIIAAKKICVLNLPENIKIAFAIIGTVIIIFAATINILGRLYLKGNWGNQIRIYSNHTLVKTGIYKYIRHPLYASTIAMLYGFALLYSNILIIILNTIIFIPFMIYRVKQEDKLLCETFGNDFIKYKKQTGMFLFKVVSK